MSMTNAELESVAAATNELRDALNDIGYEKLVLAMRERRLEQQLDKLDDRYYELLTLSLKEDGIDIKDTPLYRHEDEVSA